MSVLPFAEVSRAKANQLVGASRYEVSDLLLSYLDQIGVGYLFGVPGGAIEPLYNALARSARRGGVSSIVARHEAGAAFMADGYFRETGKLGVCCATTGPGATNLITGVASAYDNGIPLLVITGQTSLSNFGRGALQESSCTGINTVGLFQQCTRYNTLVSHVEQFERKLVSAIMAAWHTPSGPAHLSIPLDLLRSRAPVAAPRYNLPVLLAKPSMVDRIAVADLMQCLSQAKSPVFVLGEGCGEAIGEILELAACLHIPIVTTPHGKGLVSPYHPLFRGVIGFAGHSTARNLLCSPKVDLVVAVGTRLGEWSTNGWDAIALLNERLVHIDDSEINLRHSLMARLHVRGSIKTIFQCLKKFAVGASEDNVINSMPSSGPASRKITSATFGKRAFALDCEKKYFSCDSPIKPQRVMHDLVRLFPHETRFLAEPGNSLAWAVHYLHPFDRRLSGLRNGHRGLFRGAFEFASMGWAIGAAVGTAFGCPGIPVVCITGDGSILMSGQELTVAVQHRLTVVFVVLNDAALGMVKHGQRLAHAEPIGFELPSINYSDYAKELGADGYVIRSPEDWDNLDIDAICARQGPTLIDVRIDCEEVPPIAARMSVLQEVS